MSPTAVGGGKTWHVQGWHNRSAAHSPSLSDAAPPPSDATEREDLLCTHSLNLIGTTSYHTHLQSQLQVACSCLSHVDHHPPSIHCVLLAIYRCSQPQVHSV